MRYVDESAAAQIAANVKKIADGKQDKLENAAVTTVVGTTLCIAKVSFGGAEPSVDGTELRLV